MLNDYAVRFLYSAEALGYLVAGWAWWRVYRSPSGVSVSVAAACTGAGFCIKFARVSLALVIRGM